MENNFINNSLIVTAYLWDIIVLKKQFNLYGKYKFPSRRSVYVSAIAKSEFLPKNQISEIRNRK
jgi:hypothetical protein